MIFNKIYRVKKLNSNKCNIFLETFHAFTIVIITLTIEQSKKKTNYETKLNIVNANFHN